MRATAITAVRVHDAISDLPAAAWDALAEGDPACNPTTSHAFLEALEHSGCASPRAGWRPRHLSLWRAGRLIAAAPAYACSSSDGDFSRDWHWADFIQRSGIRYYPKLQITVPFTPVSGRRLRVAAGEDRPACVRALIDAARALAADEKLSSLHVLFPDDAEAAELETAGLARRQSVQFHWHNRAYTSYDDWLARGLDAKRRHQARRERAAAAGQGLTIRTVRGAEIAADPARWADAAHGLYRSTIDKLMWGRPWLNLPFYQRIFARLPGAVELVAAERDGALVAGAFNIASTSRLFGRYWGCHEEHPFLHFHVCLYHSVDDCIARGLQVFEGGAGGEHKMSRGFDPTETYSAHAFVDPRLDRTIRDHLRVETTHRQAELNAWRQEKKPRS